MASCHGVLLGLQESLFRGAHGVYQQPKGTKPAPSRKDRKALAVAPAVASASGPPPAETTAGRRAGPEKRLTEAQMEEQRAQIVRWATRTHARTHARARTHTHTQPQPDNQPTNH